MSWHPPFAWTKCFLAKDVCVKLQNGVESPSLGHCLPSYSSLIAPGSSVFLQCVSFFFIYIRPDQTHPVHWGQNSLLRFNNWATSKKDAITFFQRQRNENKWNTFSTLGIHREGIQTIGKTMEVIWEDINLAYHFLFHNLCVWAEICQGTQHRHVYLTNPPLRYCYFLCFYFCWRVLRLPRFLFISSTCRRVGRR